MPRFVRNFWGEMENTDGTRAKTVGTGPRSADGGIDIIVKIREEGDVSDKLMVITGRRKGDKLVLDVTMNGVSRNDPGFKMHSQGEPGFSFEVDRDTPPKPKKTLKNTRQSLGEILEEHDQGIKADPPSREDTFWEIPEVGKEDQQ